MAEVQKIRPSVVLDGVTYYPEGWQWVLAFAIAGVPWAEAQVQTPEFMESYRAHLENKKRAEIDKEILELEKRLEELRLMR